MQKIKHLSKHFNSIGIFYEIGVPQKARTTKKSSQKYGDSDDNKKKNDPKNAQNFILILSKTMQFFRRSRSLSGVSISQRRVSPRFKFDSLIRISFICDFVDHFKFGVIDTDRYIYHSIDFGK